MKILIAESGPAAAELLRSRLAGHEVEVASNAAEAIDWARACAFDLALIDLDLADRRGLDVLKAWRAVGVGAPVIVVASKSTVETRVRALSLGADDVLAKPFDLDEMAARIDAVARRARGHAKNLVACGPLAFDLSSMKTMIGGAPVPLTLNQTRYLEVLARRQGRTVARGLMMDLIYGLKHPPCERVLNTVICGLRRKLRARAPDLDFIDTDFGVGFSLRREPVKHGPIDSQAARRGWRVIAGGRS